MLGPLCAVLLLSGAAGLVYQVTWVRLLGLTFGVTIYAISTVLAAFMAGLAIGSVLGGRLQTNQQTAARVRPGRARHRRHRAGQPVGADRLQDVYRAIAISVDRRARGVDRRRRRAPCSPSSCCCPDRAHGRQPATGRARRPTHRRAAPRQPSDGPAVRLQYHRRHPRHAGRRLPAHRQLRHVRGHRGGGAGQHHRRAEWCCCSTRSSRQHRARSCRESSRRSTRGRTDSGVAFWRVRHLGRRLARLRGRVVARPGHPVRQHHLRLRADAGHRAAGHRAWQCPASSDHDLA